ncbi:GNAT family N-acetyltransferase [Oryzobacter terrae]|uniref:GNAT family N-acetyltransferase n=1 Tax=Oryzobacter terrae TaxID=1620385 RepID=UPI00366E6E9E
MTPDAAAPAVVSLRRMTAGDVEDVLDVQQPGAVLGLADVFPQELFPFPRETVGRRWRDEIADPVVDCLVVELDGAVVGFAATSGREVRHFGIAPALWGTGVAAAAHDALLDLMAARGIRRAWLTVYTDNHRGRRFYERLGWRPTGATSVGPVPPHAQLLRYDRDVGPARPTRA